VVEFARDSSLEGDGFEPSSLSLESSVSAALAASVAANLHPYNAPLCTPASTEILQDRARRKWRKCPSMACRTPRDVSRKGCRLPQIDQCQVDYTVGSRLELYADLAPSRSSQASPEGRDWSRRGQARTDFAAIKSNLEFIMGQPARVPTRKYLARYSLLVMVGTASLVQTLASLFR
jgi:hypothetical protein